MRAAKRVRPIARPWRMLGCYTAAAAFLAIPVIDTLWFNVEPGTPAIAYPAWLLAAVMAATLGRVFQRRWQFCQRPGLNDLAVQFAGVVQGMNPGTKPAEWRRLRNVDESLVFVCSLVHKTGRRWELARFADDDAIAVSEGLDEGRTVTGYWETFVVQHGDPVMHFQNVDSARRAGNGKLVSVTHRAPLKRRLRATALRLFSASTLATEADLADVLRQLAGVHDVDKHWD